MLPPLPPAGKVSGHIVTYMGAQHDPFMIRLSAGEGEVPVVTDKYTVSETFFFSLREKQIPYNNTYIYRI